MAHDSQMSRTERLVGAEGIERLANTCVMVLGLGGVGSNCVEALARGGIGHFILVDRDVVEESNINRQSIARHSTIGQRKVDAMRDLVLDINPQANVELIHKFVHESTLEALFDGPIMQADYLVDAIDTISSKLAIAQLAQDRSIEQAGVKLISSMGGGMKTDPSALRLADIYDTVNCRLCRVMRKECRKRGIGSLRVLYSCEQVPAATSAPGTERSERSGLGTMSYMPPIMGQTIASWVIRDVLDQSGWRQ